MKRLTSFETGIHVINILISMITLIICPNISFSQNKSNASSVLTEHITTLCSEKMGGRLSGTSGEKMAAEYISRLYTESGLKPVTENSYLQYFEFTDPNGKKDTAVNVIGCLDNNSKFTIIICAHYDHIGFGTGFSAQPVSNQLYPGADDNASGVAVLLEIAKSLSEFPGLKNNYIFAAFSGHEQGLKGSRNFVRSKYCPTNNLKYVINLEMIGKLNTEKPVLYIKKGQLCHEFDSIVEVLPHPDFQLMKILSGQDDILDFCLLNIPAITFTTGLNKDNHTPEDKPEKINIDGLVKIKDYVFSMIIQSDISGAIRKK